MYIKVIKEFKYRSKELKRGDIIEVSTDLANRLAQAGFITKATEQEYLNYLESKKDDKIEDAIVGEDNTVKAEDNKTEDLTKLKVEQLKEIAKELGIEDYENLKKAELIEAIENARKL